MNRKWLVAGLAALLAIVAVLALVVGGVVGRSIVPSPTKPPPPAVPPAAKQAMVRFKDTLTDVSIAYPSNWLPRAPKDQGLRIAAAAPDESAAVTVSVRKSRFDPVPDQGLPIVRSFADELVRTVARGTTLSGISTAQAVKIGGLPGYRYRYTHRERRGTGGANIHYVLFGDRRVIQIVLEAVPASSLPAMEPTFDRIASTFEAG